MATLVTGGSGVIGAEVIRLLLERGEDRADVAAYEKAGVTWWVEGVSSWRFGWEGEGNWPLAAMHDRILMGPPKE